MERLRRGHLPDGRPRRNPTVTVKYPGNRQVQQRISEQHQGKSYTKETKRPAVYLTKPKIRA
jgi:hypothetical protein